MGLLIDTNKWKERISIVKRQWVEGKGREMGRFIAKKIVTK